MDFESNDEINSENTHLDLNGPSGSLVDAHFDFQDFLGSDAASYDPATETSVSSGSPPAQEWSSTWMDASLDAQVTSLAADPMLFDFSALNSMGMGMNLSMPEMFTTHTSNYQTMLNPSDLHKAPTQLPQTYSHGPPQTIVPGKEFLGATPEDDIIAVVKRMTGITSAQVAGAPSDFAPDLRDFYSAAQGFSDNSNSCSSASSDRSSVPPQGSDIIQPVSPSEDNAPEMTIGPSGRPKTAHTTIERRYRTNLNTCITNLRNSIPAVRYLDKQYQKEAAVPDTLDENGCVDGVKAARKISKATIMGKAREYIVVLRRRETKLQRELEGMKELVASLVGGPILLQEWERQWAARQAQEADDEMEGEEIDSEEEDEDSADERPRKRAKLASVPVPPAKLKKPSPKPTAMAPAGSMSDEAKIPKKRGRPPKNSAARQSISISPTTQYAVGAALPSGDVKPNINAQSMQTYTFVSNLTQQRKPAYLLASFVFMSFFKPSTRMPTHAHEHSHTGTVLTSAFDSQPAVDNSVWHSHPVLHLLHSAIMVVLFIALAFSLAPQPVQSAIWAYLTKRFGYESSSEKATPDIPVSLLASPTSVMTFAEKELKESIGGPKIKAKLFNALQLAAGSTPTSDQLGVMALLHFSAKPSEAIALWKNAAALCSATSNTRSAYSMPLARAVQTVKNTFHDPRSPLVIIASKVIEERIERMLCDMFVNDVVSICQISDSASDCATVTSIESSASRRARNDLVKQAREVGGKPAETVLEWDLALSGKLATAKDGSNSGSACKSLLNVLSLMRRVFPESGVSSARDDVAVNGLPSPPPSPLLQEELVKMERILRVALDSKVFHGYHGSIVTEGELEKEKERERSEDVRKARDLLVTRLSQTARLRRLAALDGDDRD